MKQIKFLGLAALLVAVVAGSAFTVNDGKIAKRFAGSYFIYTGLAGGELTPSNYSPAAAQPQLPAPKLQLKWVFVDISEIYSTTPARPKVDVSSTIRTEVIAALAALTDRVTLTPVPTEVELGN